MSINLFQSIVGSNSSKLATWRLLLEAWRLRLLKNSYDGGIWYHSKFEPVIMNKEYIKYKDKHEKHAEVKMLGQIGKMLSGAGFDGDNVMIQGGSAKKAN